MRMNFVSKIESNLKNYKRIYTRKATTRIIDGSYKSVYKGRSMNFEEIRDYVPGDDVKDIDWKASARSRKVLVRQYIAEKKHNIMFVLDTNKRMLADTDSYEEKRQMSIMAAGTMAYLVNLNGDYVSATYGIETVDKNGETTSINHQRFSTGLSNIENILQGYNKSVSEKNDSNIGRVCEFVAKNFKRRMIVVIVTDLEGISEITESTLKKLLILNDVLVINISSALLDGNTAYDIDNQQYLPEFFAKDKKLMQMQKDRKINLEKECDSKLKKFGIPFITVDNADEIDDCMMKLLHR